jgi:hypothetical protein
MDESKISKQSSDGEKQKNWELNEVVVFKDEVVVWLNEVAVLAKKAFSKMAKKGRCEPCFGKNVRKMQGEENCHSHYKTVRLGKGTYTPYIFALSGKIVLSIFVSGRSVSAVFPSIIKILSAFCL